MAYYRNGHYGYAMAIILLRHNTFIFLYPTQAVCSNKQFNSNTTYKKKCSLLCPVLLYHSVKVDICANALGPVIIPLDFHQDIYCFKPSCDGNVRSSIQLM